MGNCLWGRSEPFGGQEIHLKVSSALGEELFLWRDRGGPVVRIPPNVKNHRVTLACGRRATKCWELYTSIIATPVKTWTDPATLNEMIDARSINITEEDCAAIRDMITVVKVQRRFRKKVHARRDAHARVIQRKLALPWLKVRFDAARTIKQGLAKPWLSWRSGAAIEIQRGVRSWLRRKVWVCPFCCEDCRYEGLTYFRTPGARTPHGTSRRVCRACAMTCVRTQIADGKHDVRCPFTRETLSRSDLGRISDSSENFNDMLAENRSRAHTARLEAISGGREDAGFVKFCREHTRICPECKVITFRYAGCRNMVCKCGRAFDWNTAEVPGAA